MCADKIIKLVNGGCGNVSDGYHTFEELYDHRNLLFINLCLLWPYDSWWNRNGNHKGYFCLYSYSIFPRGQISYHIPDKYLPLIEKRIPFKEDIVWDGHTSQDVLDRLKDWAQKS